MKAEYPGKERSGIARGKRNLVRLLSYTVIIIFVIEISRILLGIWVAKPVIAKWGVIEKGCWVEALFLRDEILINGSHEGGLSPLTTDGTRVARGAVIAWINTGGMFSKGPEEDALLLEKRLTALLTEEEALVQELKRVNQYLDYRKRNSRKGENVAVVKEDIESLEQEKRHLLRNIKNIREKILKTQAGLKEAIRGNVLVKAPETGYVFFQADNWEGKLTPDHFYALTEDEFRINFHNKPLGKQVKPGAMLAKIINPFNQIVAVVVDPETTGAPQPGKSWWFKTEAGLHKVTIKEIIPLADRKQLLAFDDPGISQRYLPERRARIFVIYRRVEGVTVPVQALYHHEGKTGVKLRKGDGYRLQEVQVLETDGHKAIVTGIDLGTTIMSR
ncbi:MAG: hypothetical protein GX075_04560 [Firmicutes bacterium]|nr:hypothetical protein [Bacillota bacterium]